jgi:23S rRNA pseudouridine1911/1915/1917 synthase
MRPGIVHRIDRDTSGLLVICKNNRAHHALAEQFAVHSITRTYRAIVYNNIKNDEGTVDAPLARMKNDRKKIGIDPAGRRAVTHYRVLERFGKYTYIECRLETGRTHQIRVHMSSIGHPLIGDPVYGPSKDHFHLNGQMLHAMTLGFIHPGSQEYVSYEAALPAYFERFLVNLRNMQ